MYSPKRIKHREYVDLFRREFDGSYTYLGPLTAFSAGKEALKKERRKLWALAAVIAAAIIITGLIPSRMMFNSFYTVIPYIFEIASCGFIVNALITLGKKEYPLHEYTYTRSAMVIPAWSLAAAAGAAAGCAGFVVFLILNGAGESILLIVIYFVLRVVSAAAALIMRRRVLNMDWESAGNAGYTSSR